MKTSSTYLPSHLSIYPENGSNPRDITILKRKKQNTNDRFPLRTDR